MPWTVARQVRSWSVPLNEGGGFPGEVWLSPMRLSGATSAPTPLSRRQLSTEP